MDNNYLLFIKKLVAEGKTKDIIAVLSENLKTSPEFDEIVMISNRFSRIEKNYRIGVVSTQELDLEVNKINQSILKLINYLFEKEEAPNQNPPTKNDKEEFQNKSFTSGTIDETDKEDINGSSIQLLIKSAEQGSPYAQVQIGIKYHYGRGVELDKKKAFEWFKLAADQDYPTGLNWISHYYDKRLVEVENNEEKSLAYLKKSAEEGNPYAQVQIGIKYHYGRGVELDKKKAFEWFKLAADQDYPTGLNWVSYYYDKGVVEIENNEEKELAYLQKSAEQGNPYAQVQIGIKYHYGRGAELDKKKAFEWFKLAADQDYPTGLNWVSYYYDKKLIE